MKLVLHFFHINCYLYIYLHFGLFFILLEKSLSPKYCKRKQNEIKSFALQTFIANEVFSTLVSIRLEFRLFFKLRLSETQN